MRTLGARAWHCGGGRANRQPCPANQAAINLSWQPSGGYGEHGSEERSLGRLRDRTGARGKEGGVAMPG